MLAVVNDTDTDFNTMIPQIITYAEARIYRELDLLDTVLSTTGLITSQNRNFTLPQHFVTTQQFNIITPSSTTNPELGTRNPLTPVSKEFLDMAWPSITGSGIPQYFAMITDQKIILGPWPDSAYTIEVVGTIQPEALSDSNTSTYLTQYLPDLFLACSMIFVAGYQKDFGMQSDNPQASASWESQYQLLKGSADLDEERKRYSSSGWSSMSPTPAATPTR